MPGSTAPANALDLPIERDVLRVAFLVRGGRRAAPGLTVRRQRCGPRQARIGCQGRRNRRIGHLRAAMPVVAVRMTMRALARQSGRTSRQRHNRRHHNQPLHSHPHRHLASGFSAGEYRGRRVAAGYHIMQKTSGEQRAAFVK